mmetsp:Transcript_52885/g.172095  ORF Transcript_52885/g.172095 Transcript_52885/m.172095 type:complete len:286 (-) Transcript_52885:285-1142(-)
MSAAAKTSAASCTTVGVSTNRRIGVCVRPKAAPCVGVGAALWPMGSLGANAEGEPPPRPTGTRSIAPSWPPDCNQCCWCCRSLTGDNMLTLGLLAALPPAGVGPPPSPGPPALSGVAEKTDGEDTGVAGTLATETLSPALPPSQAAASLFSLYKFNCLSHARCRFRPSASMSMLSCGACPRISSNCRLISVISCCALSRLMCPSTSNLETKLQREMRASTCCAQRLKTSILDWNLNKDRAATIMVVKALSPEISDLRSTSCQHSGQTALRTVTVTVSKMHGIVKQ